MKVLHQDDKTIVVQKSIIDTVLRRKFNADQLGNSDPSAAVTPGYPWTYAEANKRPIGSMFPAEITDLDWKDIYRRFQLGRRITDAPIEEAFINDPIIKIGGIENEKARVLWKRYKHKWIRFFKLVRLQGHSEMIFGWNDPRELWGQTIPQPGSTFNWLQPVSKEYEIELKETQTIPIKIESLTVNFGNETQLLHPSRFIHSMNPKLIEEDKQGESALLPIVNLLQVQIHADWSIGQALFRRASGLLGIFPAKRKVDATEKAEALNSVANHNSKTVVYVPFGWTIKDILKPGGNLAIARTYRVILEQISAGCGIPVSILIGSQRGALAPPEEDIASYYRLVGAIQRNTMEPVLKKFYRVCQVAGMVEEGEITIDWSALEAKSDLQKERESLEMGLIMLMKARIEKTTDEEGIIVNAEEGPTSPDIFKYLKSSRK